MTTLNHHTNHHEVHNMTDSNTDAPMVVTTTVEVEYIYRHKDDAEWVVALHWWEGDHKADVHTYNGRIIGQWKYPDDASLDTSDYAADILAKYAPEVMA